jgi:hypothetical protein
VCGSAALGQPFAAVRLESASPAELGTALTRAVGAPVEVRGGGRRQITLTIPRGSAAQILDRAATAVEGTWRMTLRVRAGRPEGAAPKTPDLGQELALGLQDVTAERAFGLVARELKAELDLQGELTARISVLGINAPAGAFLDRIAEQAGATWSVSYRLDVPDAALKPAEPPPTFRVEIRGPAAPPAAQPLPPLPPPLAPSGPEVRASLWAALQELVRASPAVRAAAVTTFLRRGVSLVGQLAPLPEPERRARLRAATPVLIQWMRLYRGLAPEVRKQLTPVTEFLEAHLR